MKRTTTTPSRHFTLVVLASLMLVFSLPIRAIDPGQVKPVKNIILLISDGTSLSAVSAARWLQYYRDPSAAKLNIDPWLCGTVRTNNSDAPIGDSAPTTSCYMPGQPSRAGYVSTFPPDQGEANLCDIDPARTYAPVATLLEAGKQLKGKAAGLVFTCRFPHATPADCSAHYYDRNSYELLASQMVHNNLDVVIGGGNRYLTEAEEQYLKDQGYSVYRDDLDGMRGDKSQKMWSLFGQTEMAYDMDRDPAEQPSLAEMTQAALDRLSQNKQGFFLMVEGSRVDMAAHANDPGALPNEFLAFDKACGVALDFARRDGNTVVIMTVDHGNSGFSIGRSNMGSYAKMPLSELFGQVSKYRLSADGLASKINALPFDSLRSIFRQYAGLDLSTSEMQLLINAKGFKNSPLPEDLRQADKDSPLYSSSLSGLITNILTSHTYFGWTTGGHTAEDVFLACYHPQSSQRIMGMNTNVELAQYMQALFGMYGKMTDFTDQIFSRHSDVFKDYETDLQMPADKNQHPTLVVSNPSTGKQLTIKPFTNQVGLSGGGKEQTIELKSVITYVDRTKQFYLPADLTRYLK